MRNTEIIWTCPHCQKEFELFCDDGADDRILCWNWCPYCKKKVNVWIRFKRPNEQIPLGLTYPQVVGGEGVVLKTIHLKCPQPEQNKTCAYLRNGYCTYEMIECPLSR